MMVETPSAPLPQNKAVPATGETAAVIEEFNRTLDAFREANDRRLAEIEGRLGDAVTEEKVARLDAALDAQKSRLDRLALDRGRPALEGGEPADGAAREHKAAFDLYVRAGESAGLKRLEAKALSAGSGPDGGYLVPDTVEREVLRRLATISPIRAIATVQRISGGQYKRAVTVNEAAAGWVGETDARPQTGAPTLSELSFPAMELYAMPAATQTLLDDAVVDVDRWLADEVETVFAEQEGAAFVAGNGTSRPQGFLTAATVANTAWVPGRLGFVGSGAAGAFAGTDPADALFDLVYALRSGYRQNYRARIKKTQTSDLGSA